MSEYTPCPCGCSARYCVGCWQQACRCAPYEAQQSSLETPASAEVDSRSTDGANEAPVYDVVQKPLHYNSHPSGVECIQITEHMNYCLGNAIKYIWRADLKGKAIQDLRKAIFYIEREIALREST